MSSLPAENRNPSPAAGGEDTESVHQGMEDAKGRRKNPWLWVLTAYFAEGVPYAIVQNLAIAMFKDLGISNAANSKWTSYLYIPWVIKCLWGPLVDQYGTKRNWVVWMQGLLALCFAGVGFAMHLPEFFIISICFLWLMAFFSATHDIACDGFYMLGLTDRQQAWFVGIRSTAYRLAMIVCQGLLLVLAFWIQSQTGLPPASVRVGAKAAGGEAAKAVEISYPYQIPKTGVQGIVLSDSSLTIPSGQNKTFFVRLAQPPDPKEPVVVKVHRVTDDPNLKVSEGERLEFTNKNWDQPTTITVAAAKGMKSSSEAEFIVSAGNIRLSWTILFFVTAVGFGLIALWHFFMLPHPKADRVGTDKRPPFMQPVFWLGITMAIPMVVIGFMYWGLGDLFNEPLKNLLVRSDSDLAVKGWDLGFGFVRAIAVILIIWAMFFLVPVRKTAGAGFHMGAKLSGIPFDNVFVAFFQKHKIGAILAFLLLFRLGEAQLLKIIQPFLLDTREAGGLGLDLSQVGWIYGTVGKVAMIVGGVLGGLAIATHGLGRWILPMALIIHVPDLAFIYLAYARPEEFWIVNLCVTAEQFGFGFGFTAYMMYMVYCAKGNYKTSHFALMTGFMAAGMMIPGFWAGYLQELIGYFAFFIVVCACTLPSFVTLYFIPLDRDFGKKGYKDPETT